MVEDTKQLGKSPSYLIKSVESHLQDLHSYIRKRTAPLAREKAQALVKALGNLVGYEVQPDIQTSRTVPPILYDSMIKFHPTRLRGFDRTLRAFVSWRLKPTRIDYDNFKNEALRRGLGARLFFIISPGSTPALKRHAKMDRDGLVILDADDIGLILNDPLPRSAFNRIVSQYVDIDTIQPFDFHGEARNQMFFGRDKQIRRIKAQPERSFAIFGGRRIGKTSLLKKLQIDLKQVTSNEAIFISAQGIRSNIDLCGKIMGVMSGTKLDPRSRIMLTRLDNFTSFFKQTVLNSGKHWTVLVDEFDDLIYRDRIRRYEVLSTLRAIDSELREACRFVFAGFRTSYQSLISHYSPFQNFVDPITLDQLDPDSAKRLVVMPIEEDLGYSFANPTSADRLLEYTSRHPAHIQRFCSLLVRRVHSENRYIIYDGDIDNVFHSNEFRHGLLETFYWNTSPSEKLIIYLFIVSESFTINDVYSTFTKRNLPCEMSQIMNDLMRLVTFGHLSKAGNTYYFAHAIFPSILREAEPVGLIVEGLAKELRQLQRARFNRYV